MSATSGGGGSVSEGSETGGSSQSTMSASDSPSTSFQNNLAENVTKITLSEENSAEVTGSKINLTLDERQQKDGIVNVAFDYEDETNRGSDFKSNNGSEKKDKVPEAVNLELVNMVPYSNGNGTSYGVPVNGIPMKKDSEQVDMSTPYDEYFVPVNEHKKYMRGEKLYVTKDKRRPTSWRRCLSWIVACTVISVVLIVAILAGTGVILSQEQNYIKEASVGRNFAGSNLQPSVTNNSPSPTAEMYMYVPRSIESEFVIDNLDFDPELKNVNSSAYQQFASTMEDQLKMLLFNKETLEFEASDVGLKIVNVSRDPFKVNYRIGWNYKQGVNNPPEPIKMEDVKKRLVESLARNQGYIDKYHIDKEAIKVNHVLNSCQMDNGGCSHICYYNYITQEFTCTCPTHLVLDGSGKNCVAWTGPSEDDAAPVPSHASYPGMPYESNANPAHVYDSGVHHQHGTHHHFANHPEDHSETSFKSESAGPGVEEHEDFEPGAKPEPEPTAEPSPSLDSGTNYDHHNIHSAHDTENHDTSLEQTAEPNAEDSYHGHVEHSVYESKEPSAEPAPEPNSSFDEGDHKAHSVYGYAEHEPSAEPTPEPAPEPSSAFNTEGRGHNKDNHSFYGFKDHEHEAEPTPEPAPEPTAEPNANEKSHDTRDHYVHDSKTYESDPEHSHFEHEKDDSSHSKVHESSPESIPEPIPEPGVEENKHEKTHDEDFHSRHRTKDDEPLAEPTLEPALEPSGNVNAEGTTREHFGHSVLESKDHEPSAESTPEPSVTANAEGTSHEHTGHSVLESKDHEPSAEPTPEPSGNVNAEGTSHEHTGHSVLESKDHEPSVTANAESTSHEHFGHSVLESKDHEPSAEPTPEPSVTANAEGTSHELPGHSVLESKDHEPSAEPTPEPSGNVNTEGKSYEHTGHSVLESKDHEPSAEPTPEPSVTANAEGTSHELPGHSVLESKDHEPSAEPTPEPSGNVNIEGKSYEHTGHSVLESKDHEPSAEPTPEPSVTANAEGTSHEHFGHSVLESKDHKPSAEPTPEPSGNVNTEGKSHEHTGHSVLESKDHEPAAEPTPESESNIYLKKDDHDSVNHGVFGSNDHKETAETTPHPGLESNINDQSTHSVSEYKAHEIVSGSTKKPEVSEESQFFLTQKPASAIQSESNTQPSAELPESVSSIPKNTKVYSEPQEYTKSDHSLFENSNLQSKTSQGDIESKTKHSPEVQLPVHSETNEDVKSEQSVPYLKDILIAKPSLNETGHSHNPLDSVERTPNGEPVIEEIIIEKSDRKSEGQTGINSFHPVVQEHINNESDQNSKNLFGFSGQTDTITDPSNKNSTSRPVFITEQDDLHSQGIQEVPAEHTKTEHSTPGIEKSDNEQNKNVKVSTNISSDQGSLSPELLNSDIGVTLKSDTERNTNNPLHESSSVTTIKTETQPESYTVPVSIELLESKSKINEGKLNAENQTNFHDFEVKEGPRETEHDVTMNPTNVYEPHQRNAHETASESQASMTTSRSSLLPKEVENINEEMSGNEGTDGRKVEIENNVNQTEGNETKSPEEISNNIKDELLDNEEFNILIDKEVASGEGKDRTSKYPNKSLKNEKKKSKDYHKGEKTDSDKKSEISRPGAMPEDFILQKHVNGNENSFDLDYSLQNEHTTKHDGGVAIIDPHGIEGVPGVSFKPHGINNHDISALQTVAPDFKTEAVFPGGVHELETFKPELKNKQPDNKDLEFKLDKDYKFDKDYKYEKQKVSKKKDLKKKVGGKDGKNVELDDGRKYYTKDDWDVSQEAKDFFEMTMNPSLEKDTTQPDADLKIVSGFPSEISTMPESFKVMFGGSETTLKPEANVFEVRNKVSKDGFTKQLDGFDKSKTPELIPIGPNISIQGSTQPVDQNGHLMIDEPSVKSSYDVSAGTVYDDQMSKTVNSDNSEVKHVKTQYFSIFPNASGNITLPGTVFDGIPQDSFAKDAQGTSRQNTTFTVFENTQSIPKIFPVGGIVNSTTADPTIIIHGQSGNLQNGHLVRFANSTFYNPNPTIISIINGSMNHPDGHSFSLTNYTATFPNGSAVKPTIVVHGQSGALQDGHEIRFGNLTFQTFVTPTSQQSNNKVFTDSNVYRIENGSAPGTVFDGHFNPKEGHYHMFTNSSGTFVYSNSSTPPGFIIAGQSGDFGNATAYILGNSTTRELPKGFTFPHSVIFRNSTVFAVENVDPSKIQQTSGQPREVVSNETIHFTHQMSPGFVMSGTAYKVNDYFSYISKCAAGQFQCLNGTSKRGSSCISLSSKCDSINDCSDGSDEMGCIENGCPGNFQCSDNTCLKRNLVCNGILDCSDGSDEKNCESWKCEFDEFQCPSGRCIPIVWQCDNKPDCDNHTDEYNCQTSCGNDEYLCPEGWCIPLTYKCNGVKECSNGEDEQLCVCSHDEFKCQTGGCVSKNQVCNGLDDCPDRSDEWDCVKLESGTNLLKIRSPSGGFEPVCADNWTPKYSDEVCASLGYFSSVPIENENSSVTTETSFYKLRNDTTADFNRKIIVNLEKNEGSCSSGKLVEISCQEFSCGSRSMTDSSSVEARLVGGVSATAGQWPSVALIYNIRNFHSCTANVLTPRWVLASYNCLKMGNKNLNEQDWKFFGGSTVFEAEKDDAETRKILSIIPHPQVKFNQFLFTNDLALVELEQSLQFTSNLGAVCLPEQEIQPRQICVTAGWGMNNPEDKTIKQQLQYLPVPTMNLTECNSTEHYSGFITEDKICAGYNSAQKSLCYNEEGAPLMCVNDRGEWELQGVLSYHSNCGRGSHPSIFSSITPVKDWIKKTIRNNFERKTLPITKR